MSQVALFSGAKVPGFARKAEPSALAKALAGSSGQSGKRISLKGNVFRLIHDGKEVAQIEERKLPVVIVNAAPKVSRTFTIKAWDPENPSPPDCWSSDGNVPDAAVQKKQHANCVDCPQNVKGSGQGESKACRYQQRLAVIIPDQDEDGALTIAPDTDVLQLPLPALSIFGKEVGGKYPLQAYARFLLAHSPPIDPNMLVTELRFDTKAEHPKLFFKPLRWLTEAEYAIAQEKGESEDALKAIEFQVDAPAAPAAPIEGKPPAKKAKATPAPAPVDDDDDEDEDDEEAAAPPPPPPPARKKKVTAPPPPPADDDDDDDEDEEEAAAPPPPPAVRKSTKTEAPAVAKPSLAALASTWDDEDEDEDD